MVDVEFFLCCVVFCGVLNARLLVCVSVHARFLALCSRLFGFCALTICVASVLHMHECSSDTVENKRFRVIV